MTDATVNFLNAIPPRGAPFLNPDGSISQPWLFWFLSLQARTVTTGTASGGQGISTTELLAQLSELQLIGTMADEPRPVNQAAPALMAEAMGFAPRPVNFLGATLMADAMAFRPSPVAFNPFLAAMVIK
jgi:hypothetical protein